MINKLDEIEIIIEKGRIRGLLKVPYQSQGIVLFAHGSGSGRLSPRNQMVAEILQEENFATLLMDLLTEKEEALDEKTGQLRFDITFLSKRLVEVTHWLETQNELKGLSCGYFGASTGAAAALVAASLIPHKIKAVVSRGGRPDLAANHLPQVVSSTLLIVGGNDYGVIELNREAFDLLSCTKRLEIVPGATHLFEEPGALVQVAHLANAWFKKYLTLI